MGWKQINGRRYFYKSEREGGRVKSTYFGAGQGGLLMAEMIAFEQLERAEERERERGEREGSDAEERAISDWFDGVQAVADAAMIAAGFHKRKGQWRRKRRWAKLQPRSRRPGPSPSPNRRLRAKRLGSW
jgi:hypothetical protein